MIRIAGKVSRYIDASMNRATPSIGDVGRMHGVYLKYKDYIGRDNKLSGWGLGRDPIVYDPQLGASWLVSGGWFPELVKVQNVCTQVHK